MVIEASTLGCTNTDHFIIYPGVKINPDKYCAFLDNMFLNGTEHAKNNSVSYSAHQTISQLAIKTDKLIQIVTQEKIIVD